MDHYSPTTENARDEDAAERSLRDDLKQFAEDARVLAEAEIAYHRSRVSYAGKQAPRIAVAAVAAFVFLFFTIMAAIVGAIFALAPLLTRWGAMGAVTGALLLLTVICALIAKSRFSDLKAVIGEESEGS